MERLPYRELLIWQKAHALALAVLDLAETAPIARRFYFRDQLCSSAMSVAANIAEGDGRGTDFDFAGFLDRARGSLFELDTWLYTAVVKRYIDENRHGVLDGQVRELNAMLFSFRETLRRGGNTRRHR